MQELRKHFYFVVFLFFFILFPLLLYVLVISSPPPPPPPPPPLCVCPTAATAVATVATIAPWDFYKPFKINGESCASITIIPRLPKAVPSFTQCVRVRPDIVSSEIKSVRRWRGCDNPIDLFLKGPHDGLFLDVGANIGSCTLLALAVGARVIAFEPLPSNIFYFHQSVAALDSKWKERLTLWPVALGSTRKQETIYTEPGNAGNSALEFPTRAKRENSNVVQVVPLDDILWPHTRNISVLKMDVQGYEIHVLEGAKRLLQAKAIHVIQTEISTEWLTNLGRKPSELCAILWNAGFEIFEEACVGTGQQRTLKGRLLTKEKCKSWDGMNAECDMVARLKKND